MRDKDTKVELFSYIMILGEELLHHYDPQELPGVVDLCITVNNARKELVKQANNVRRGEGSVNGKWYEGDTKPFKAKIKRVRANIIQRVVDNNPLDKLAFDSTGEVYILIAGKIEIDVSKF